MMCGKACILLRKIQTLHNHHTSLRLLDYGMHGRPIRWLSFSGAWGDLLHLTLTSRHSVDQGKGVGHELHNGIAEVFFSQVDLIQELLGHGEQGALRPGLEPVQKQQTHIVYTCTFQTSIHTNKDARAYDQGHA
eukprot:scaffold151679_cov25-Tisochrysis_lutea.AAC.1